MTEDGEPAESVGDVADRIGRDIRRGVYHPRERLIEADLCARYGASRDAVRAALIELTAQGLVEREANRGARVRRVTAEEALEAAEVRFTLQAMCAAAAATHASEADRDELMALMERLRDAVEAGDRSRTAATNDEISSVIRRIGGHTTATRIIESLQAQSPLDRYPYQLSDRRFEAMYEYEAIITAIVAGDEAGALAAATRHRDTVLAALRDLRETLGDSVA